MMSTKPVSYIPQSPRLLDQLREVLRYKHYSLRTEEAYLLLAGLSVRRNMGLRPRYSRWVARAVNERLQNGTFPSLMSVRFNRVVLTRSSRMNSRISTTY